MGYINHTQKTFLSIMKVADPNDSTKIYARIVTQFKAPIDGVTIARVNANKKTVHEKYDQQFMAHIVGIGTKEIESKGKKMKMWEIMLNDNGSDYNLSFPYRGYVASYFMMALPNVDFNNEVIFSPYFNVEKDKLCLYLNIPGKTENGKPVSYQWKWTKDEPGDLPPLKEVEFQGKIQFDDTQRMKFWEDMLENEIRPRINMAIDTRKKLKSFVAEVESADEADALADVQDDEFLTPEDAVTQPAGQEADTFLDDMNAPVEKVSEAKKDKAKKDDLPF